MQATQRLGAGAAAVNELERIVARTRGRGRPAAGAAARSVELARGAAGGEPLRPFAAALAAPGCR